MKIIKKVKYENVYRWSVSFSEECFICQEVIQEHEKFFNEDSIFIFKKWEGKGATPNFNVCTGCAKTPEKAEKVIIPLLKILYGKKITVIRYEVGTRVAKKFYY